MHSLNIVVFAVLIATLGCGGGGDAEVPESGMDGQVVDAAGSDGSSVDSALGEDGEVEPDGSMDDAAVMDSSVPDASVNCDASMMDAGTRTLAAFCTELCGMYLPLCAVVPENCQSGCETANAGLTPSELGSAYACIDIASAGQCSGVPQCLAGAIGCE